MHLRPSNITARIPHQSRIGSSEPILDSFPPGEALGAPAPDRPFMKIIFSFYFLLKFFIFYIDKRMLYGILKLA